MRVISCRDGKLQELAEVGLKTSSTRGFQTGIPSLDDLAPERTFTRGGIHEILSNSRDTPGVFFAAILAQAASSRGMGVSPMRPIIWSDPQQELYPPALANLGIDLSHLYLLHPTNEADEAWAVAECLKCKGVGAVIASPNRLSRIIARKLQLAAETGNTVGILLRNTGRGSQIYAAATRWLVAPAPGERTVQRWNVQLLHGHGGRINQSVFLEHCRETNSLRASAQLADRSNQTTHNRQAASA